MCHFFHTRHIKHSIFRQLLFTYFCISIPLYGMYLIFYYYSFSAMKKEYTASFSAQSNYFLRQWDSETNNITNMMQYCIQDQHTQTLGQIPDMLSFYEQIYSMNQIEKNLNTIEYSSKYIKGSSLFLTSLKKTISSPGGIQTMDPETLLEIQNHMLPGSDLFIYDGVDPIGNPEHLFLGIAFPFMQNHSTIPISYMLLTELSIPKIQTDLALLLPTKHSLIFLHNRISKMLISSSSEKNSAPFKKFFSEMNSQETVPKSVSVEDIPYTMYIKNSPSSNFQLISFIPTKEQYSFLPVFQIFGGSYLLLCALLILIFSMRLLRTIKHPFDTLIEQFQGDERGDLKLYTDFNKQDEFQKLYQGYNAMVNRIHSLIRQVYVQQLLVQKAELKQLQSQINPHFLYNSFFMLSLLARNGDTEKTALLSKRLGEYFRYITRNASDDVSLAQEREHAQQYADIQQIRFSNRLTVQIDPIPDEYKTMMVPRLILQPVLENFFEHGMEEKISDAKIVLHWIPEEKGIRIVIEDNGDSPDLHAMENLRNKLNSDEAPLETTALVNIHHRLKLRYQNESGVELDVSSLGGWKVSIRIIPSSRIQDK